MSHFRLNSSVVSSAQRTGRLDLHGRSLYAVPSDVFLREVSAGLQVLDLSENKLSSLPSDMGSLQSLRELFLDNNALTELPVELLQLPNLRAISLDNNPRLPKDLQAIFDKAAPQFKSQGRDAAPILAWIAAQAGGSGGGGGGGGGGAYRDPSRAPTPLGASGRITPLQGAARAMIGGGYGSSDRQDEYQQRSYSRPQSQQQQQQQQYAVAPSSSTLDDDDDLMYAQMRARAAARATASAEQRNSGRGIAPNPFNDDPSPRYERDQAQAQGRDFSPEFNRAPSASGMSNSNSSSNFSSNYNNAASNGRQSQSQSQAPTPQPGSRLGMRPQNAGSPFYADAGLKMEGRDSGSSSATAQRQAMQARLAAAQERGSNGGHSSALEDAAAARNKEAQRASNIFSGVEAPRQGRRITSALKASSGAAPFATEVDLSAPAPQSHGGRGSSSAFNQRRSSAPFGTDFNQDVPQARRQPDLSDGDSNKTSMAAPWAASSSSSSSRGATGNSALGHGHGLGFGGDRGVRITRPGQRIGGDSGTSPFGTLPPQMAATHYQTSSASAASHVQTAAKLRAAGGIDVSAAYEASSSASVNRSSNGHVGAYEDGSITGNGPRSSGGLREAYGRANSDVYGGRGGGSEPPRGDFSRDQHYAPAHQQGYESGRASQQSEEHRRNEGSRAGSRAGLHGSNGNGEFSAPFGRDTDAPPAPNSRGGNRANQSSVFGGPDDAYAPPMSHGGKGMQHRPAPDHDQAAFASSPHGGKGGSRRPAQDTKPW